jgi:hypothetical protein
MQPVNWDEQKEIKIPTKLYEMLERRAREDGTDTDIYIKYILLDALAPSVAEQGRRIGQQAAELGKQIIDAMTKSKDEAADEPPELLN